MRQIMFGGSCIMIFILGFFIVMTIEHGIIRDNELNNSLSRAIEKAVDEVECGKAQDISDDEEFVAVFTEALLNNISSGTEKENGRIAEDKNFRLVVDIIAADYAKGIVSVRVTEQYTHPNGKIGKLKKDATAILERTAILDTKRICFIRDDITFAEIYSEKGQKFPEAPVIDDKLFVGWAKDGDVNQMVFPEYVDEDVTYVAVYKQDM